MVLRPLVIGLYLSLAIGGTAEAALADDLKEVNRLHHAGQTIAALERADRYLAGQPKDAQMRFLKAVLLTDAGRSGEGAQLLQQLVQEYPELAEPHNNLAAIHAAAGDFGKARDELDEALRLNPGYAPAQENLGDIYTMLAGQSYAKALRLEPASTSLPKKLALVRQLASPLTLSVAAPASTAAAR